jgi:hypothetical protein
MEDESGKLIDGTARALQWRRSRSASARTEGHETRSAAPKSIAASLLVPAEMLAPATSLGSDAGHVATATDEASAHINPFLMPEAFGGGEGLKTSRKSGRRAQDGRRRLVPAATSRPAARLTIPIVLAVAAVVATTIVVGGGGESGSPGSALAQSIGGSGAANSLERLKPGLFASNPFGVSTSTNRSAANASARAVAHRSRINGSGAGRIADRPSVGGTHHTTTAADHPSASIPVTRAVTPQVERSRPALSTATHAQPVVSHQPGNSNANAEPAASNSRPAFGSDGLLGPGSSPDS